MVLFRVSKNTQVITQLVMQIPFRCRVQCGLEDDDALAFLLAQPFQAGGG